MIKECSKDALKKPPIARKCSDFDHDCYDIEDHSGCFLGGYSLAKNMIIYETAIADGFCPFLIGMEK